MLLFHDRANINAIARLSQRGRILRMSDVRVLELGDAAKRRWGRGSCVPTCFRNESGWSYVAACKAVKLPSR
jgi:hypothetical protein